MASTHDMMGWHAQLIEEGFGASGGNGSLKKMERDIDRTLYGQTRISKKTLGYGYEASRAWATNSARVENLSAKNQPISRSRELASNGDATTLWPPSRNMLRLPYVEPLISEGLVWQAGMARAVRGAVHSGAQRKEVPNANNYAHPKSPRSSATTSRKVRATWVLMPASGEACAGAPISDEDLCIRDGSVMAEAGNN
ncbi:hypothetical protein GGX14DRAFT_405870 [Mycena pura]|uniref:Uncharacterized protein n=1 Tax=Mycena pura TaxID=153505 RepID=A0AAD6XYQ3_9AGAR|nr:hypothetical protein GGX14DRAFT_405870 [Mycena pura]